MIPDAAWDWLWSAGTLLYRSRTGVLTMLLPGWLAWRALRDVATRGPRTLYSLLLLRVFDEGRPSLARTLRDVFSVTAVACAVVGLGAMGVRLVDKHGAERLALCATPADPAAAAGPTPAPAPSAAGWPGWLFVACGLCGLAFPATCVVVARREHTFGGRWAPVAGAVAALAGGMLLVAALALALGIVRQRLFGADDWILPFQPPAFETATDGAVAAAGRRGDWLLEPVGRFLTRLNAGAGYVDSTGRLYRSHVDMTLAVIFAGGVYAVALVQGIAAREPSFFHAPTGVYLLIVIGTAGTILGGVAFWCDRYGLPAILLAVGYVAVVFKLCDTDHYFELYSQRSAEGPPPLPLLAECFARREFPRGADGTRTMTVVTAAGGGVQAAAWTAEVLTGLASTLPGFRESLGILSGVSGGSVGCGYYLAAEAAAPPAKPDARHALLPATAAVAIRRPARSSLLEPLSWGVAFPEILRLVTGVLPRNRLIDRGWAVEQAIERRLRSVVRQMHAGAGPDAPGAAAAAEPLRLRDLAAAVAAGRIPLPLFNATAVQTGQRVVISPVRFQAEPRPNDAIRTLHLPHDYEQLAAPLVPDPTLAAAVRLSATFSYASPVARPLRPPAATRRDAHGPPVDEVVPATDPEGHTLFDLHLCDGGYADNTGVVAAVEACVAIIDGLPADRPPPFDRIHVLRIEPFPAARGGPPRGSTGFWKAVLGPVISLLSARVATQLDRAGQDLDRLAAIARRRGIDVASTTIRFGDHADPHTSGSPPLSWALSAAQQTAIEHCWQAWEAHGRAASQA